MCKIFYTNSKEYTLFSATHRAFSKINHRLGHKPSLKRYKKINILFLRVKCFRVGIGFIFLYTHLLLVLTYFKTSQRINSRMMFENISVFREDIIQTIFVQIIQLIMIAFIIKMITY